MYHFKGNFILNLNMTLYYLFALIHPFVPYKLSSTWFWYVFLLILYNPRDKPRNRGYEIAQT